MEIGVRLRVRVLHRHSGAELNMGADGVAKRRVVGIPAASIAAM